MSKPAQTPLLTRFSRSRGFTLVEVLIALAITAFVATIAYTSLSTVIDGVESTREAATKTYELDRALMIVSRDIQQFVARPVMDEFGQLEPALSGGSLARFMLSFTRSGWHNPRHYPRSNLQRINYMVEDDALWRESYLVLDRVGDTQPRRVKLLEGVLEMNVGFLGSYGQAEAGNDGKALDSSNWAENWIVDTSTPGAQLQPPVALELTLEIEGWGEIKRLYEL